MPRLSLILAGAMLVPAAALAQNAPSSPPDSTGTTTTSPSTPRDDRTGTTEERIEERKPDAAAKHPAKPSRHAPKPMSSAAPVTDAASGTPRPSDPPS